MFRLRASAFILFLILLLPFAEGHASQTVKVAITNNPPLFFTDEQGEPAGIYVDVINYIAEQEDWAIEFVPCKWQECQDKVKTGEMDLLMSVAFSEKRSEIFEFTQEIVFSNWAVVYRKPLSQIESISDLKGERVAASKGSIHASAFISLIESFGIDATIVEVDDYVDVFKAIKEGEASAGVASRVSGIKFENEFNVKRTSIIFNPVNLYFATPKGKNSAIRAAIDYHVKRLKADQSSIYYQSMNRWLTGIQSKLIYRPTSATAEKPIYFAGDMNYPPLESLEDGSPTGINIEILQALSEVMKREFEINLMQWSMAQEKVLIGEADALTLFGPTKKRRELYDFSDTLLNSDFTLFKRNDDLTIRDIKDVEGKVVGVTKGGFARQALEANKKIKLHFIKNNLEGFQLLEEGKINAVATNKWVGTYTLQKNNIDGISVIEKPFAVVKVSIAVKKGNTVLLDEINLGIRKLNSEGTIDKIMNDWSSKRVIFITEGKIKVYQSVIAFAILSTIFLGIFVWILMLKRRSEEELRASEERFSKAFHNSPMMMSISSLEDGTYIDVNKMFLIAMGYEWEEMVGRTSVGLGIISKEDRKAIVEKLSEDGIISHYECNLRTKSGDILRCFLFVELINIAGEDRLVSSILDITDQKKAEKERRNLEVQLQHSQKLESLGVLAGGIAHDFNNLLMGIMGNVGMAQMKLSPESPGHTHLSGIQVAAERAAELTNQMLAYSGKGKFDVKSINLTSVIEEMSHLLQVSVSKNVTIKYELDKDLPTIEADPSQLHQILMNLLTNASDSFDGKSGDVVVSNRVKVCDKAYLSQFQFGDELPEGKYVYLEVSDTGSGMDDKTIERIFDPFFSTKDGGRGLGLSAVIGIVRGHNGAIKVISEPDRGTTFKLLFPASEKTADEIVEESLTHIGYRGEGTILVVDDEEGVRDIASSVLAEFGFEVLLARDGEEALELFKGRADEISLVLLDLSMPGMGGIETFRHLKQHWDDVKVILSSGYTEEDAVSSFTGQGLADFIQKPYRPEELISKVRKVLEQES